MKIMVWRNNLKIRGEISVRSLLRNFRSGFQMLSKIEWISGYGSHLSVATVLGVAGFVLAVRDGRLRNLKNLLKSDEDESCEKLGFVPGLRNLGNNCFLNVVLQSLASCSSFRRFVNEVKEVRLSSDLEKVEDLPLLMSLAALLEEMCTLQDRSRPLNPQNLMSAMQEYIPQFHLTNEQDSAEALLHLLSCLRAELSDSYTPNCGSLADVDTPTSRFLSLERINKPTEPRRWWQDYVGPFDGIIGSSLSCRSCSSEIVMDFGFFHTWPLLPIFNAGVSALGRFTLEDCIKRFLSPERVENYSCSRCWHIAALKYLSSVDGQQEEICKVRCCSEQYSCDCRNMTSLQGLPWSNRFCSTYKQFYIANFPQILCLHLQRTSMNSFGELVKIQGHISFPLILDLSPFLKYEVGSQRQNVSKQNTLLEERFPFTISSPGIIDSHRVQMKAEDDGSQNSPELCPPSTAVCFENKLMHVSTDKVAYGSRPSKNHLYRLVSVVEHFGGAGSGHYTVYRGVKTQAEEGGCDGGLNMAPMQWFRISDSNVQHASKEDVLGADASLLYYERI